MSSSETQTFRCRPSPVVMLLSGLFFVACAAVLICQALTTRRGLSLFGLIELRPAGAGVFCWILGGLACLFVLTAIWTVFTTFVHGIPDVVVTRDAISFPVGFPTKKPFTLPFSEVTAISTSHVSGQRFLTLQTRTKKHHIALNWLGSRAAAESLVDAVAKRLAGSA